MFFTGNVKTQEVEKEGKELTFRALFKAQLSVLVHEYICLVYLLANQ